MPALAVSAHKSQFGHSRPITREYGLLVASTNKDASPKQYALNTAETPSEPCQ
ncbi:hypothetical protein B0H11DRAFT_2240219 [Mycena galericulata]|nr:hypothetical protein B0H11DRAFT_2240219 [Mycena galericulata]